jgi:hypothetical protein
MWFVLQLHSLLLLPILLLLLPAFVLLMLALPLSLPVLLLLLLLLPTLPLPTLLLRLLRRHSTLLLCPVVHALSAVMEVLLLLFQLLLLYRVFRNGGCSRVHGWHPRQRSGCRPCNTCVKAIFVDTCCFCCCRRQRCG